MQSVDIVIDQGTVVSPETSYVASIAIDDGKIVAIGQHANMPRGDRIINARGKMVPAAVTVFANEYFQTPRIWAERAYRNLIYFNEVDRGGHFAAWEQPALFAKEIRAAVRALR